MRVRLRSLLLFVTFLIPLQIIAQKPSDQRTDELLQNPRRSLHTFLHWQQKGHINEDLFGLPMELYAGSKEEKIELSEKLKKVLDAKGLIVVYEQAPGNKDYIDSLSGTSTYILFNQLPEVYLIKNGNRWLFSKATIESIPDLYESTFNSVIQSLIDKLPEWFDGTLFNIKYWQYAAIFIWLLTGLIIRKLFEFILSNYVIGLTKKTSFTWDDELLKDIKKPSGLIFLSLFFYLTYTNLLLPVGVNYYLSSIITIVLSIAFIWLLYNLSDVFARYISIFTSHTNNKLDDELIPLIRKTIRFFIVVMGVIIVLQNHGYNVASLIAGLGIGGLAVALAARDTLANFFGSITILLDKPFRVGDWVQIGGEEGIIEEVGFRSTRIRTFYNSLVSVPNSKVADTAIDNLGLRKYRRLKMNLGLTYSTKPEQMEAFVEGIKGLVKSNSNMRQDYYEVHFNSFGAHSLDVLVYVFFDVPDWSTELQERHNFLLSILQLADEIGVEFAFPTQTLQIDSFYGDEPRKVGKDMDAEELGSAVYSFGPKGNRFNNEGIQLYKDGKPIDFGANK